MCGPNSSETKQCLEKERENRYQNASDVRVELEKIEQGLPTTDRVFPKKKTLSSREITVRFKIEKLLLPSFIALVIVAAGLIIWKPWKQKISIPGLSEKPSVAVLPFQDLSIQKDQDHLCRGIAISISTALSKIEALDITSPDSAAFIANQSQDFRTIGDTLGVKTLLMGDLLKEGDHIRIFARLLNVTDGSLLWSEQYESNPSEIFSIQDKITLDIVDTLKIELLDKEREEVLRRYTDNTEAYILYTLGRFHWNKRTEDGLNKAIEYFNQTLELDPTYALAYVGIADSYILFSSWNYADSRQSLKKAKTAVLQALDIDENLAEAHCALARITKDYDWDWAESEKEFKEAIELNPKYATAHQWYAELLTILGRHDEAIDEITKAQKLDPLSRIITSIAGGYIYFFAGEYEKGMEQCNKALDLDPTFVAAHWFLGRIYRQKGKYEESIEELEKALALGGGIWLKGQLAITYALSGDKEKALRLNAEIQDLPESESGFRANAGLSRLYFALGDNEKGFLYLNKSYEDREYELLHIHVNPLFDGIRDDSRFKTILRKMNLD